MCKCKSFWESCYWHCCEKHFCWDEQIALYEEEKENTHVEPPNVGFDNLAFYDNVALIANRAIFTIEPLSTNNQKPVVEQPKKKLRWFEDEEIQNHINETRSLPQKKMSIVPEESDTSSIDTLDMVDGKKETTEPPTPNNITTNNNNKNDNNNSNNYNNNSIIQPRPTVELRKKSLPQRRLSRALTLQIDRKELPLIRQSSMPKFYVDTPEVNQIDSCVARTPSITLNTPIRPQSHEFNYDLSSVVQIQREQAIAKPARSEVRRATSLKEKIKRQSSLVSLTSSITGNYM